MGLYQKSETSRHYSLLHNLGFPVNALPNNGTLLGGRNAILFELMEGPFWYCKQYVD